MPMPNPGFDVFCSTCGRRLAYVRTEGDKWVYLCLLDGAVKLAMSQNPAPQPRLSSPAIPGSS